MLKIAICDDDALICKELKSIVQSLLESIQYDYKIFSFGDGESLLKNLSGANSYDIIFLDVRMKKINGIQTGKAIRNYFHDERTKIIFVSAIKDYVFEAFDARPVNFIVKPVSKEKVEKVLKKTIALIEEERGVFIYKSGYYNISVYLSDIQYFESMLRKVRIVTSTNSEEYYGTMSDVVDMNLRNFIQIHRSFLINVHQIDQYKYTSIRMKNGHELGISQNKRAEVMEALTKITLTKLKET